MFQRSKDLERLDDVVEDIGLANGTCWHTDQDNLTGRSDVLGGLGNGRLGNRHVDDTVRSQAVGSLLDVLVHLLGVGLSVLGEVDEHISAHTVEEI